MAGIQKLRTLERRFDLLTSELFLERFPGILGVAGYYDRVSRQFKEARGSYPTFDEVGIENVSDFLVKLEEGNSDARRLYETVRDTLTGKLDDVLVA